MIRITISNLARDAGSASADLGRRSLGELSNEGTIALLEKFRVLDPVENLEAEPEIVLETRLNKFVIRTVQQRLYLYNPRRFDEPALKLTAGQIVAEFDGTGVAARTRAPFPARRESSPTGEFGDQTRSLSPPAPPENLLKSSHRLALAAALVGLCSYLAYPAFLPKPVDPTPPFEAIRDISQIEKLQSQVAGVYVTGNTPGNRGIALAEDGTLKLFEFNADSSPSLLQSTFQVGQSAGAFVVSGRQIGGLILPLGKSTLRYAGETYRRVE